MVIGASAALLVSSLIPLWATLRVRGEGVVRETVWSSVWGWAPKLAVVVTVAALALALVRAAGVSPSLPVSASVAYAGLEAVAAALMFVSVITGPRGGGFATVAQPQPFFGVDRGLLVFLGLGLCLAIVYGGLLHGRGEVATAGGRAAS